MLRNSHAASLILALIIVALWALVTYFGIIPRYVLPSPTAVVNVFKSSSRDIVAASANTLCTALAGFCISIVFGLIAGFCLYESKALRHVLLPIFVSVKSTPIVAIVPIVTLFLKVGLASKIALALTACFFPMVISTYTGLAKVSPGLTDFARSVRSGAGRYFLLISLPSAANELGLGIKITLPLAFIGAVVAEMAGGDDAGIGYMIVSASYRMDSPRLYASVLVLMILSSGCYFLVTTLMAWVNPAYRDS